MLVLLTGEGNAFHPHRPNQGVWKAIWHCYKEIYPMTTWYKEVSTHYVTLSCLPICRAHKTRNISGFQLLKKKLTSRKIIYIKLHNWRRICKHIWNLAKIRAGWHWAYSPMHLHVAWSPEYIFRWLPTGHKVLYMHLSGCLISAQFGPYTENTMNWSSGLTNKEQKEKFTLD